MSVFSGESEPALKSVGVVNPKEPTGIIFFPRLGPDFALN